MHSRLNNRISCVIEIKRSFVSKLSFDWLNNVVQYAFEKTTVTSVSWNQRRLIQKIHTPKSAPIWRKKIRYLSARKTDRACNMKLAIFAIQSNYPTYFNVLVSASNTLNFRVNIFIECKQSLVETLGGWWRSYCLRVRTPLNNPPINY